MLTLTLAVMLVLNARQKVGERLDGERAARRFKQRREQRAQRVHDRRLIVQQNRALVGRHVHVVAGGGQLKVEQHEREDVQ